jgi:ribosome-binding factor A
MSRTIRLGEQIREEVSDILGREVRDPGIGFLTLTRVRVTDDLSQARIYYTMLGDPAERKKTARALERAVPFIRRSLAERLHVRRMPELAFEFDQSVAHQARVEELLEEIKRQDLERALEAGDSPPREEGGQSPGARRDVTGTVPADAGDCPQQETTQDTGDCPQQETNGTVPKDPHEQ